MTRFIQPEFGSFTNSLVEYFRRFIFATLGFEAGQEIPLTAIREHLLQGKEGSHLLSMFCGADF